MQQQSSNHPIALNINKNKSHLSPDDARVAHMLPQNAPQLRNTLQKLLEDGADDAIPFDYFRVYDGVSELYVVVEDRYFLVTVRRI